MRTFVASAGVMLLVGTLGQAASAQDSWDHDVTLYFLGAGMTGEVGVGGATANVDLTFGEILENLDFSFMAAYRMQKSKWSLGTDVIYIGLKTTADSERTELDVDQWLVELNSGYAIRPFLTLLAGARYNSIKNRLFFPATETKLEATEDWVDPLVGARLSLKLGAKWMAHLRADIGGFGIGSDLAWQVLPLVEWNASERLSALLGYRVIAIDYANEHTGFKYDGTISGPGLGLNVLF